MTNFARFAFADLQLRAHAKSPAPLGVPIFPAIIHSQAAPLCPQQLCLLGFPEGEPTVIVPEPGEVFVFIHPYWLTICYAAWHRTRAEGGGHLLVERSLDIVQSNRGEHLGLGVLGIACTMSDPLRLLYPISFSDRGARRIDRPTRQESEALLMLRLKADDKNQQRPRLTVIK